MEKTLFPLAVITLLRAVRSVQKQCISYYKWGEARLQKNSKNSNQEKGYLKSLIVGSMLMSLIKKEQKQGSPQLIDSSKNVFLLSWSSEQWLVGLCNKCKWYFLVFPRYKKFLGCMILRLKYIHSSHNVEKLFSVDFFIFLVCVEMTVSTTRGHCG